MHPDTYVFLAGERIADIQRDVERQRLTSEVPRGGRATILHRKAPVTANRGAR